VGGGGGGSIVQRPAPDGFGVCLGVAIRGPPGTEEVEVRGVPPRPQRSTGICELYPDAVVSVRIGPPEKAVRGRLLRRTGPPLWIPCPARPQHFRSPMSAPSSRNLICNRYVLLLRGAGRQDALPQGTCRGLSGRVASIISGRDEVRPQMEWVTSSCRDAGISRNRFVVGGLTNHYSGASPRISSSLGSRRPIEGRIAATDRQEDFIGNNPPFIGLQVMGTAAAAGDQGSDPRFSRRRLRAGAKGWSAVVH